MAGLFDSLLPILGDVASPSSDVPLKKFAEPDTMRSKDSARRRQSADNEHKLGQAIKAFDDRMKWSACGFAEKGFPEGLDLNEELPGFFERWKAFKEEWDALPPATENRLKIVVTGKFSSGKSSFINSLIGCDLAPSALDRTTRALTHFVGDAAVSQPVFYDNARKRRCTKDEYQELVRADGCEPASFTIRFPTESFRHYEFIDTPGFDPADEAAKANGTDTDGGVSRQAAKDADVMFFLFDMREGKLGSAAIAYMNEWLKDSPDKRLYLVSTFADKKPEFKWKVILDQARGECEEANLPYGFVMPYTSNDKNKDFKRLQDALFASTDRLDEDAARISRAKRNALIALYVEKFRGFADKADRSITAYIERERIQPNVLEEESAEMLRLFVRVAKSLVECEEAVAALTAVTKLQDSRGFLIPDDWCAYIRHPDRDRFDLSTFFADIAVGARMRFEEIEIPIPEDWFDRNLSELFWCCYAKTFDNYITRHYLDVPSGESNAERNERLKFYAKTGFAKVCASETEATGVRRALLMNLLHCFERYFEAVASNAVKGAIRSVFENFDTTIQKKLQDWKLIYEKEMKI